MTLTYERAVTPASGWDAWGTLVSGTARIPLRRVVVFGGIAFLLLTLLIRTGEHGVVALWTNALFLGLLVLIGSSTRTVGLWLIFRMFFVGSALIGLMYLLSVVLAPVFEDAELRGMLVPIIEETLKVAPVMGLLWVWRRGRSWSLGATDVLLVAAASGVGFGVVEDAYIRADSGWPDQIAWLPVTELIGGRLIVGHGIWTALAGATIGLGLLLRHRGRIWLVVALVGLAVSVLDHVSNNYGNAASGPLADALATITVSGWLPLGAFLIAFAVCVWADLAVQRGLEALPHRTSRPRASGVAGLVEAWDFLTLRRALAVADFHWRRLPDGARQAVGLEADYLDDYLASFQPSVQSAPTGAPGPPSQADGPGANPTPNGDVPPASAGRGGAMLLVLSLVGVAVTGTESSGILAALDVGANCDPACLASGAGGAGGAGGPGGQQRHYCTKACWNSAPPGRKHPNMPPHYQGRPGPPMERGDMTPPPGRALDLKSAGLGDIEVAADQGGMRG